MFMSDFSSLFRIFLHRRRNIASKALGSELIEGYRLTDILCDNCGVRYLERDGTLECVACQAMLPQTMKQDELEMQHCPLVAPQFDDATEGRDNEETSSDTIVGSELNGRFNEEAIFASADYVEKAAGPVPVSYSTNYRQNANDIAAQIIGIKFVEGYRLTNIVCKNCGVHCVERDGTVECAICPAITLQEEEHNQVGRSDATEAQYRHPHVEEFYTGEITGANNNSEYYPMHESTSPTANNRQHSYVTLQEEGQNQVSRSAATEAPHHHSDVEEFYTGEITGANNSSEYYLMPESINTTANNRQHSYVTLMHPKIPHEGTAPCLADELAVEPRVHTRKKNARKHSRKRSSTRNRHEEYSLIDDVKEEENSWWTAAVPAEESRLEDIATRRASTSKRVEPVSESNSEENLLDDKISHKEENREIDSKDRIQVRSLEEKKGSALDSFASSFDLSEDTLTRHRRSKESFTTAGSLFEFKDGSAPSTVTKYISAKPDPWELVNETPASSLCDGGDAFANQR